MRRFVSLLLAAGLSSLVGSQRVRAADEWGDPEVIAEHVPGGPIGIPLRGLIEPGGRTFVVWAEKRTDGERVLVAERDDRGAWARTELASIDFAMDLEPKIVRADDGTLVVAWGGGLGLKGGGFSVRKPGTEAWTKPQPLHPKCTGKVDLVGGAKVTAAYVRAVKKTDLGKLFGNVIHDPPRQEYGKPAIAQLEDSTWTETNILEKENFLECDDPCIAGEGVIYFRDPDKGPTELAWSSLTGKDPPEVISKSTTFRYGTHAALTVQSGEPVVAIHEEGGVVLRRRTKDGWGDPTLVFPGWGHGIRLAVKDETIHVACATGGSGAMGYAMLKRQAAKPVTSSLTGSSCDLCLDQGQPVLFLSQQEKVTGTIAAEYRLVMVRRPK